MTRLSDQTNQFRNALLDLANALALSEGGGDIAAPRMAIIGGVKIKIDEMMPEGEGTQFSVEDDTNNTNIIDLYINSRLDPSTNTLQRIAPLEVINGKASDKTAVSNADYSGYVILPDDFIRLKSFRMVGWLRDVNILYTPKDAIYAKQKSIYLRGKKVKPVCILNENMISIDNVMTVTKVIEYYSLEKDDDHVIEKFIYIPEIGAEDVQENLKDALEWICASEILQITGYPERAKMAMEQVLVRFKNLQ
jgi:hypothetical protein